MPKRLKYSYHLDGSLPENHKEYIFVFGSNLGGFHKKGAAVIAHSVFNAEMFVGIGLTGRSYAIPTKDRFIRTLDIPEIKKYVDIFSDFTHKQPDMKFWITAVGCGLAGYKGYQIAPLFKECNVNCSFPHTWKPYLK